MEELLRIACWRCDGKCQEFGWAHPGDPKQTWHPCEACGGRGWVLGDISDGTVHYINPDLESPQAARVCLYCQHPESAHDDDDDTRWCYADDCECIGFEDDDGQLM